MEGGVVRTTIPVSLPDAAFKIDQDILRYTPLRPRGQAQNIVGGLNASEEGIADERPVLGAKALARQD